MPLTKSEFDIWKAKLNEAYRHISNLPCLDHNLAFITREGLLNFNDAQISFDANQTRALYEMLKIWFDDIRIIKEVADAAMAYIASSSGIESQAAWIRLNTAVDTYRLENNKTGKIK